MTFSFRIITVDHYMSKPITGFDPVYSHFRSTAVKEVPVIRVFGVNQSGKKVCAHIHGVFPYICIPIDTRQERLASFNYNLAESLDIALNSLLGGNNQQHVYSISVVSAIPFYGFHSSSQTFLRIEFYRPYIIKKAVQVVQAGMVLNQMFQPHEAHVPYILQFFIDYNLYGMNFLNLSEVNYRVKVISDTNDNGNNLGKITSCQLEVDALAKHILNKLEEANGNSLNPGLSSIRQEELRRRTEEGLEQNSLSLSDSRNCEPTKSDIQFQNQFFKALQKMSTVDKTAGSMMLSQSSSTGNQHVKFDSEDVSVLKLLLDRLVAEDCVPDEDSILGSWSPHDEEKDRELVDECVEQKEIEDLSQPFVSFIELSDSDDEAIPCDKRDSNSSDDWKPLFVDGITDDDFKEGPSSRKLRTTATRSKTRYQPLNIRVHKSPRKNGTRHKKISSPEIFKTLEKNVAELRKIKSPKNNKSQLSNTSSIDFIELDQTTRSKARNVPIREVDLNPDPKAKKSSVKKALFEDIESHSKSYNLKNTPSVDEDNSEDLTMITPCSFRRLSSFGDSDKSSDAKDLPKNLCAFNISDSDKSTINIEGTNANSISSEVSNILPSVRLASPTKPGESSHENYPTNNEIDDYEMNIRWNDVNATQSSIASFYGDCTLPVAQACSSKILTPALDPPTSLEVEETLSTYNFIKVKPIEPFYSNPSHSSSFKEVGFNLITLKTRYPIDLEEFTGDFGGKLNRVIRNVALSSYPSILVPAIDPPTPDKLSNLICENELTESSIIPLTSDEEDLPSKTLSQESPKLKNKRLTQVMREKRQSGDIELSSNNSGQFKMDFQNMQEANSSSLYRYTTLMVLEVHTTTRIDLCPDPEYDAIQAVFYLITNDVPPDSEVPPRQVGVIVVSDATIHGIPYDCHLTTVTTEEQLFCEVLKLVSLHDPDIIAGYEIEMQSWGYLIERGYSLGLNLLVELSRLKSKSSQLSTKHSPKPHHDYDLRIPGRIVLNVWRLMRHEVALMSYTFESVIYHILHTRVPKFSYKTLTQWWNYSSAKHRHLVIKYYFTMVDGTERLLDQLDLIKRTSELASLFGIQFYEVFSRGSQFRVESMMLRLAKRFGFIAVSPSVQQRAHMMAPQSLPLIMEPESRFYGDPVIVLDFQSLYPSMMIAYNYCFSTCLGQLSSLSESNEFKFGCTSLKINLKELIKIKNNIHVSPAGIVFVDKSIRKGVLPQMLEEILETRLLVKSSMKRHKNKKLLIRALDARQLGLKLIANVTYGYTSANFSGRMPCIEVGDSVVSKGRETLERAIKLVKNNKEWNARVVYGDTDSLFVLCPGRSKQEAFEIGQQIADSVTNSNPPPVKLKLEKIFLPCILQTKKRYVGYMYESVDQETPVYCAKGIETVRRDGCPAASKILEKSLKLLFNNGDISSVRQYVRQQLTKVLSGRLNPAELAFAKEYRGLHGYHPTAPVPALKIAKELISHDRRAEPRRSERVPYVVVCGPPGLPIISLVKHLPAYLNNCSQLVLNSDYYITKAILPPLARCFSLLGADVFAWYSTLPKKQLFRGQQLKATGEVRRATIAQFFTSVRCVACSKSTPLGVCEHCQANPSNTVAHLSSKIFSLERKFFLFERICQSCCGRLHETDCTSLDCPVLFRRVQTSNDAKQTVSLRHILKNFLDEVT